MITPEQIEQALNLRSKIDKEPNVYARIALYNDPKIPFAVRFLAITEGEEDNLPKKEAQ